MAVSAVIGVSNKYESEETIYTGHHGPVVRTKKVKTGQGVLEAGLIVAVDSDGKVVPYDPNGSEPTNEPVGVLLERCDTSKEDAASIIVHGTVWKDRITVKGENPSADDLGNLEKIGIWAMP